jgi:1-deoxy-D-xylulose-5-phosphate reductoisomerase
MAARSIAIFGSTGSVGVSTLDLLSQVDCDIKVTALTAGRNVEKLVEQAKRWRPDVVVIEDERCLPELRERLNGSGLKAAAGAQAIKDVAGEGVDWVMSAIVGAAGLAPTLAAARAGSIIALANKESLVCAGPALLAASHAAGGNVIPVDSEHSAIFQVLQPAGADCISRLILTASGGPFRGFTREEMSGVSTAQALAHPKWSMGPKISIDSATMMNKGLEMIEASYLFAMPSQKIDVLIHPQSVVHSLVEYADGSTLAQLGSPDMRTPIACAWAWPGRVAWPAPKLDLAAIGQLTFEAPDETLFPALRIARECLNAGAGAPAAMNAANEVAVGAFLDRKIGFLDIAAAVSETLERLNSASVLDSENETDPLECAMMIDASARRVAAQVLSRFERMG